MADDGDAAAAAYYDEQTRKGKGAARYKQREGFSSSSSSYYSSDDGDGSPARGSINPVRTLSRTKPSKRAQLGSVKKKLSKKPNMHSNGGRHREARVSDNSHRSKSRDRERRYRKRSRSRSSSPRRSVKRRNGGGKSTSRMTAAEKRKGKKKLQLAEIDEGNGTSSDWESLESDEDGEIDAGEDDAAHMGQSFRLAAIEERREGQIEAAHDKALYGSSRHAPTGNDDAEVEPQSSDESSEGGDPAEELLSYKVSSCTGKGRGLGADQQQRSSSRRSRPQQKHRGRGGRSRMTTNPGLFSPSMHNPANGGQAVPARPAGGIYIRSSTPEEPCISPRINSTSGSQERSSTPRGISSDEQPVKGSPHVSGEGMAAGRQGTAGVQSGAAVDDSRHFLSREGRAGYTPNIEGTHHVSEIIRRNMCDFYPTWKKIPEPTRWEWFGNWKQFVRWAPGDEHYMWRAFNRKSSARLSDIYSECKRKKEPKTWMGKEFWEKLQQHWQTKKYKRLSESNRKNRASAKGGNLHTGGSLSIGTHRARLAKKLGREPDLYEVFSRTRKRKSDGQWVEKRAAHISMEYENKLAEFMAQHDGNDSSTPASQELSRIFREVVAGYEQKGRVYGLSFYTENERNIGPPEHVGSSSAWELLFQDMQMHVSRLEQDFRAHVTQQVGELRQQMSQEVAVLRQHMSDELGEVRTQMAEQRDDINMLRDRFQQSWERFDDSQRAFQRTQEAMLAVICDLKAEQPLPRQQQPPMQQPNSPPEATPQQVPRGKNTGEVPAKQQGSRRGRPRKK